ncbi:MAG: alpha-1,2-fucosyltransferase [Candidatus Pacearchaeota archaeon]|jgi:Icc-related predicted phosphoesterase
MIIAEIGRGLGNSMYVYAAAKALSEKHKTELKLDKTYLQSWPRFEKKFGGTWDLVIEKFNISSQIATKKEIKRYIFRTYFRPIDKLTRKLKLFERNVYRFPSNGDAEDFFKIPNNSYLIIYCGREKFFKPIENIIKKEFELKEEYKKQIKERLKEISSQNSISIHVRRGDVLKLKNCLVLSADYYKRAIEIIKKQVKNPIFYIFSDEIDWCKENLSNLGIKLNFVEGNKDYEDLELMKSCKHNILANSALSWWAGYLNKNPKKIVIAPKSFSMFKDSKEDPELPKNWIKIEEEI